MCWSLDFFEEYSFHIKGKQHIEYAVDSVNLFFLIRNGYILYY